GQLGGRLIPIRRGLGERAHHCRFDSGSDCPPECAERRGWVTPVAREDDVCRGPADRRRSAKHLLENAAQRIDVGPAIELGVGHGLLGRHVCGCTEGEAGLGDRVARACLIHGPGNAEVRHHGLAVAQEDVGRLDVTVHDAMAMGIGERGGHLPRDAERFFDGKRALARKPVPQAFARKPRHHVIGEIGVPLAGGYDAGIEERDDVGMVQLGGKPDLAQKAVRADHRGDFRTQHLDGDRPVVAAVVREEDEGLAALADPSLHDVSIGQGRLENGERIGHAVSSLRKVTPLTHHTVGPGAAQAEFPLPKKSRSRYIPWMPSPAFDVVAPFQPAGDQPGAIAELTSGLVRGDRYQTLLGVTGSGKTMTLAHVIANYGKPTLVLSHNKTLAAQLYGELRQFLPRNAVEYFVSYYDYYQPEAYVPSTDVYIEKDA